MALIPKLSPILFALFTSSIAVHEKVGEKVMMRHVPKRAHTASAQVELGELPKLRPFTSEQPKRALLAFYGLQNRDRGCALPSHRSVQEQLQSAGFTVDTFVYEFVPHTGDLVDNVRWVPGSLQNLLLPSDGPSAYKSENVSEVDASIHGVCGETFANCQWGNNPDPRFHFPKELESLRLLYSEQAVANYLKLQARSKYQLVVGIRSDYALRESISKTDMDYAAMKTNDQVLFVSPNAPFDGYTDGFYMGSVDAVATAMSRFSAPFNFDGNYEQFLKHACDSAGLHVRDLSGHRALSSIAKVRHNGNIECYNNCPSNGHIDVVSIGRCLQAAGLATTWKLLADEADDAASGSVALVGLNTDGTQ